MKKFSLLVLSTIFATGAFAASHMGGAAAPEVQAQGNPKAQSAAEAKHNARLHGIGLAASQPEAQMQANPKGQSAAERKHNAKYHGYSGAAKQPEAQAPGSTKTQ